MQQTARARLPCLPLPLCLPRPAVDSPAPHRLLRHCPSPQAAESKIEELLQSARAIEQERISRTPYTELAESEEDEEPLALEADQGAEESDDGSGGGATPSTEPSPKGEKAGWRGWAKKAKDKAKDAIRKGSRAEQPSTSDGGGDEGDGEGEGEGGRPVARSTARSTVRSTARSTAGDSGDWTRLKTNMSVGVEEIEASAQGGASGSDDERDGGDDEGTGDAERLREKSTRWMGKKRTKKLTTRALASRSRGVSAAGRAASASVIGRQMTSSDDDEGDGGGPVTENWAVESFL